MLTVCPKCNLSLVVTATDLRAAQGHVRCGRCRSVFNALESLAESPPEENTAPARAAADPMPEDATAEPLTENEPAQEEVFGEPELDLSDQTIEADEIVIEADEPELEPESAPQAAAPPEAPRESTSGSSAPLEPPAEFELETSEPRHRGLWLAGACVLALLLAGQAINHYRGTLATFPSVGPPLRAVYGALGIPVVPLWNVHAYDAHQLGATVSGANPRQITVRASIANTARGPLPLPLLRVTLQDRYGRVIAARDVAPRKYLPASFNAASMLAPGQRVDASVTFENPGPQAVGFEIDTCLREGAAVVCTHGPSR